MILEIKKKYLENDLNNNKGVGTVDCIYFIRTLMLRYCTKP